MRCSLSLSLASLYLYSVIPTSVLSWWLRIVKGMRRSEIVQRLRMAKQFSDKKAQKQ